jgi:hypothetical protein
MILHHRAEGADGLAPTVGFANSLGTALELWDEQAAAFTRALLEQLGSRWAGDPA